MTWIKLILFFSAWVFDSFSFDFNENNETIFWFVVFTKHILVYKQYKCIISGNNLESPFKGSDLISRLLRPEMRVPDKITTG